MKAKILIFIFTFVIAFAMASSVVSSLLLPFINAVSESNIGLNAIAQLTAHIYGTNIHHAQGLGTGQLFADNVRMPLKVIDNKLWITQ